MVFISLAVDALRQNFWLIFCRLIFIVIVILLPLCGLLFMSEFRVENSFTSKISFFNLQVMPRTQRKETRRLRRLTDPAGNGEHVHWERSFCDVGS